MKICIAGKSLLACKSLDYGLQNYPELEFMCLPSKSDPLVDTWQPSLRKHALDRKVTIVTDVKQLYELEELIFISLEFDSIILPHSFKSSLLFNLHFSFLPLYRGVYTSIFPILNGETDVGVTLHWIDEGIDTGDIVAQRRFKLPMTHTSFDLYTSYIREGFVLFQEILPLLVSGGKIPSIPQSGKSSYYSRKDLNLNLLECSFNATSDYISKFYRSRIFPPYQLPIFNNYSIKQVLVSEQKSLFSPGTIVRESSSLFEVSTLDNNILLFYVSP